MHWGRVKLAISWYAVCNTFLDEPFLKDLFPAVSMRAFSIVHWVLMAPLYGRALPCYGTMYFILAGEALERQPRIVPERAAGPGRDDRARTPVTG